jgi:hypothetical protein
MTAAGPDRARTAAATLRPTDQVTAAAAVRLPPLEAEAAAVVTAATLRPTDQVGLVARPYGA